MSGGSGAIPGLSGGLDARDLIALGGLVLGVFNLGWTIVRERTRRLTLTAHCEEEGFPVGFEDPSEIVRIRLVNTKETDVQVVDLAVEQVRRLPLLRRKQFREEEFWDHRWVVNVPKHSTTDLDRPIDSPDPSSIDFPRGMKVRALAKLATGKQIRSNVFQRLPHPGTWEKIGVDEKGMEHWRRSDGAQIWKAAEKEASPDEVDIKKLIER